MLIIGRFSRTLHLERQHPLPLQSPTNVPFSHQYFTAGRCGTAHESVLWARSKSLMPRREHYSVPFMVKRSLTDHLSAMSVAYLSLMDRNCIEDCVPSASAAVTSMLSKRERLQSCISHGESRISRSESRIFRSESHISRSVTSNMYGGKETIGESQSSCVLQLNAHRVIPRRTQ